METIISNPGLQHLAEKVFLNLEIENLKICAQINQSSKQILEDPKFWLKKFKSLSKENQKDWIEILNLEKKSVKRNAIISYLQWELKKKVLDIPCYTRPDVQRDFWKKINDYCRDEKSSDEGINNIQILAHLRDNPNAPNVVGNTPIHWAARKGHTEIVKILSPLTGNPNPANKHGETPIYWAASEGYTEIVKILAPLTDNPNAPDNYGKTPAYLAALNGHTEIVKILTIKSMMK